MKSIKYILLVVLIIPGCVVVPEKISRSDAKKSHNDLLALAKDGDADAQVQLGLVYFHGRGVSRDFKESVKWTRMAAQQGNIHAQFRLGQMYYYGRGVPANYLEANKWVNLAGMSGHEDAIRFRFKLEKKMSPGQIEKAQKLAKDWLSASSLPHRRQPVYVSTMPSKPRASEPSLSPEQLIRQYMEAGGSAEWDEDLNMVTITPIDHESYRRIMREAGGDTPFYQKLREHAYRLFGKIPPKRK